jgi:hypothetical protein
VFACLLDDGGRSMDVVAIVSCSAAVSPNFGPGFPMGRDDRPVEHTGELARPAQGLTRARRLVHTNDDPCGRHVDVHVPRIGPAPEPVKPANV